MLKTVEFKMDKEKDFFNNDNYEIYEYWEKHNKSSNIKDTIRYFTMIFNNVENRINRDTALKEFAKYIVTAGNNYTSINSFQNDNLDYNQEFDKMEKGHIYKNSLKDFKEFDCVNQFKKNGNKDLNLLNSGEIKPSYFQEMILAISTLKDKIFKDEKAKEIFDEMMLNEKFKKEFDNVDQKKLDIKEMKENLKDNHFKEWTKDIENYYKTKGNIPEGDDVLSVEYRNKVMPEIDKMANLIKRLDSTGKDNYSTVFSIEEQEKIQDIRFFIEDYETKKMNSKIQYKPNQDFINNQSKIEEVNKKVESNNNIEYKDDLKFLGLQYNNLNRNIEGYSLDRQIIDMTMLQQQIERLPNKVDSDTDNLLISDLKSKINNNDYILLNDFNNTMKNIESLKSDGVLRNAKIDFNNINDFNKSYVERDLKSITEIVTKIENKHGVNGLPLFDEIDKFKFMEYKAISDSYKKYQSQELKTDIKNKV